MATKLELHNLVNNNLQDNSDIPAIRHREVEDAIIDAMVDLEELSTYLDAYSIGASYFWKDSDEKDAEIDIIEGDRGLQIDTGEIYEYSGIYPVGSWVLVGALSGLGINESDLVHKSGTEPISGLKTFTGAIPLIDSGLHPPTTDYQLVDKKYVDDEIASAGTANQTVQVTVTDTTPGYLEDKIVNNDGYINISTVDIGGGELVRQIDFNEGANLHNGFGDYVANEHINHTSVTLTAGAGLSGGGDISSNRTFDIDINSETSILTIALDDELLISDTSNSNAIRKIEVSALLDGKEVINGIAQYWYNTINEQASDYLYDNAANTDTKLLLKINGTSGKSYELTKANFYYVDNLTEEVTSPAIKIYQNTTDRFSIAGAQTINPGSNNLLTNLDSGVTWSNGDNINIYVTTGTGTSSGSQIYGYFYWEVKEV